MERSWLMTTLSMRSRRTWPEIEPAVLAATARGAAAAAAAAATMEVLNEW